jgi:5-methylcytosine-specific restriction endonuclease McrA
MYVNKIGIVAVGKVQEQWDGNSYTAPLYYTMEEIKAFGSGAFEYRIRVNWYQDFSDKPITAEHMRQSLVPIPPRAFSKIKLKDKVEEMLRKLQTILPPTPKALDLEVPSTERVESTIYRILRDTAMALKVKHLHNHKCQICGHTIELPGGGRYAEAHHIKPLGEKHNGPDVIGNILCVCPNHHAELDYGVSTITISALTCFKGHEIDPKYIDYHNQFVYKSILST